jgi:hypothetical protein
MKVALVFLSVLASLSALFAAQQKPAVECRGKSLPITLLPGPKMTGPSLPLRFGGTREFPRPPINNFRTDKGFRLVIKSRDEFSEFWKRFTAPIPPSNGIPPPPEIDFTNEFIIVAAMGERPTSGYWIFIDGACEVDGHVEVFVTSVEDPRCMGVFPVLTYSADAVRIPRTDLPIIFRETQVSCTQWRDEILRFPRTAQ